MKTGQAEQTVDGALAKLRDIEAPIDRYVFLRELRAAQSSTFYALLTGNAHEVLPFVYTPTVGEACQRYHELKLKPWGQYISYLDRGNIARLMRSWPQQRAAVIVVTDGQRILGLGDLGSGGMGIAEGKIMLYTVAAGVDPFTCLPICLDVGTNNQQLLDDPQYPGLRQRRVVGADYYAFVDEFMTAVQAWQPHCLVQFEDFGNHTAFKLLHMYQPRMCCFNDDIQGTACVTLAGVLSAIRATGSPLEAQRIVFLGAGEAGVGIGELISRAIAQRSGKPVAEARKHCFYLDSKGLVCAARDNLQPHKRAFAHDVPPCPDLVSVIHEVRPTVLIGVSTIASAFTRDVFDAMLRHAERPIVFPLSNPTTMAECTFEQAVAWTNGRVLFASGSPFPPIEHAGVTYHAAQANNAYVFPAIGHAAVVARARSIPDGVFLVAAEALAEVTTVAELDRGWLFPSFNAIQDVSRNIMLRVCAHLESQGLGTRAADKSWAQLVDESMWRNDKCLSRL